MERKGFPVERDEDIAIFPYGRATRVPYSNTEKIVPAPNPRHIILVGENIATLPQKNPA
jgi:hypothetical protein